MGPGGGWHPKAGWVALFGDETAMPAIARILEAMPSGTHGSATILIGSPQDVQQLARPDGVSLRWLLRSEPTTLLDVLGALEIPADDRFVWFASERSQSAAARKILDDRGILKGETRVGAYWTR